MYCKTSYDTTAGKVSSGKLDGNLRKLDLALREAMITGGLKERRLGVDPNGDHVAVFLIGADSEEVKVPPFIHPYLIQNFKNQDYLVTDLRSFGGSGRSWTSDQEFEASVRNTTEYALAKSRAVLNLLWLRPDVSSIRARFSFAGTVFAAWLSQAISKAYALDFHEQLRLTAVAVYYYHTLFQTEPRLSDKALEVAVVHTIKATKLPAAEVYSLFEKIGDVPDINSFCHEIKHVVESIRLQDFNLAMLVTLIGNTWYGTNAKDLIAVALEHPPTWISIVYTTLTERTYKSSALYRLIEIQGKRGNADEFRMNYLELIKNATVVVEAIGDDVIARPFEDEACTTS